MADEKKKGLMAELREGLATAGIKVPDDTSDDDFLEHLNVAVQAHNHAKSYKTQTMSTKVKRAVTSAPSRLAVASAVTGAAANRIADEFAKRHGLRDLADWDW